MQKYSKNLVEIFYNTQYAGAITGADVIVKNQDNEGGEIVKIYLVVRNDCLQDCSFQAKGSIVLYASLTTICSLAKGKTLSEILSISEKDVINELKQLNKQEYNEIVFALESFKKAVEIYLKRKKQGTIVEKNNLKSKNLHPSKNVTKYQETSKTCNIERALAENEDAVQTQEVEVLQPKKEVIKKVAKVKSIRIEEQEEKTVQSSTIDRNMQKLNALINEVKLEQPVDIKKTVEEENSEMMIVPVGGKKKQKKSKKSNVVIPTKIEVRVFEDDDNEKTSKKVTKTTKITTTKTIKTEDKKENPYLIQVEPEKSVSDEEVIDEIDSITEQLTNAISQLNFKFDDEEK